MDKKLIADIFEWDIVNWSKSLDFWSKHIDLDAKQYKCLELGANRGGLSLWLALSNNQVICSDLVSPEAIGSEIHTKYGCADLIEYQNIDATNIPFENHFDIVIFKSIIGGISGDDNHAFKKKTIDEIYKSLKPGGHLLFAENLQSSSAHMFLRNKFKKREVKWNYIHYDEIEPMFTDFKNLEYQTIGFFGTFGLAEWQRQILGHIDTFIHKLIPSKKRYIVIGIAEKEA